jgi:activating signal cointegrator complex subunit 3
MALMNKPTYRAIIQYSPQKPVLVFVSSRRQTRLTAFDLIALAASDESQNRFLHMDPEEMRALIQTVRDSNLRQTLEFGIGLHHAGLHERDRNLVEELFTNQKIQLLITTATLAWGVNLPAHAVLFNNIIYCSIFIKAKFFFVYSVLSGRYKRNGIL